MMRSKQAPRLPQRANEVWSHHLVLVLDDVAVPNVQTRRSNKTLSRVISPGYRNDRVLEACLPGFRWASYAIEWLTVDVDGVSILREVVHLPDLDRVEGRISL
jgi:hypothetical protein